jgi:RNA polymerase sigma-70 factor (ECF subfamily)
VDSNAPQSIHPSRALDFESIRRRLTISVRRVCPRWLADRADDIVQEAMLRVLGQSKKNEQSWEPPASFLWKVAYSATVDEIRRLRRRRESGAEMAELEREGPIERDGPYRASASAELADALGACLAGLREARRLVVGLHLLGHDHAESVARCGWPSKRVRNLLYRGLADLRACLTAKGF